MGGDGSGKIGAADGCASDLAFTEGASKRSFYREPNEGANDAAQQPYWILCNVAQHLKC